MGKPGGDNKLFFYYSHEYRPTNAAINNGNPIRLRVPTALSAPATLADPDNNGNPFTAIRRLLPARGRPVSDATFRQDPGGSAV